MHLFLLGDPSSPKMEQANKQIGTTVLWGWSAKGGSCILEIYIPNVVDTMADFFDVPKNGPQAGVQEGMNNEPRP